MVSKTSTGMQKNLFNKTLLSAILAISLIAPASAKAKTLPSASEAEVPA